MAEGRGCRIRTVITDRSRHPARRYNFPNHREYGVGRIGARAGSQIWREENPEERSPQGEPDPLLRRFHHHRHLERAVGKRGPPLVRDFLAERTLELSMEKTHVVHISEGFDFLGWNIRMFRGKTLIQPAKKNKKAFLAKVRAIIRANKAIKQSQLIWTLNPIIRGWVNYHRHQVASDSFRWVDHHIWRSLWRWAKRRHPTKSCRWVRDRYFPSVGTRSWCFAVKVKKDDGQQFWQELVHASDTKIKRHRKIRAEANPFDPAWDDYFEKRRRRRQSEGLAQRPTLNQLWRRQNGLCPHCRQLITKTTGWHIHHIVPRKTRRR